MDNVLPQMLQDFFAQPRLDARRIFHGRGQCYPGLEHITIDWYKPLLLITCHKELDGVEEIMQSLSASDQHRQIESVLLQRRNTKPVTAEWLRGKPLNQLVVEENGLRFEVHPGTQQNTGLFLDMRPLREILMQTSQGKNVLNLFAYTCSLSVAALAGGAAQVCNVDMSKTSIQWGEKNHLLNNQDLRNVRSIPHNIFRSWGRIKQMGRYNTLIIDPPARQRGSFDASKNYGAVIKKLGQLARPGADVYASLNSPFLEGDFLLELFDRHAPEFALTGEVPAAEEFMDKFPQRALKIFHFRNRNLNLNLNE